jgi:hypothetical protein
MPRLLPPLFAAPLTALLFAAPLGCDPAPPPPGLPLATPGAPPATGAAPATDARPAAPALPATGPDGALLGFVFDAATGAAKGEVPVVEMNTEPPNAATSQADGHINLTPKSWTPAQVWTQPEGSLGISVAVDAATYKGIGEPIRLDVASTEAGVAAFAESTGMEWPEGVGVVRLDFSAPRPQDAEGLTAMLTSTPLASFVVDKEGAQIPGHTLVAGAKASTLTFVGVPPGPTAVTVTPNPKMKCTSASTLEIRPRMLHVVPVYCIGE